MNKNKTNQLLGTFIGICAVLFAVVLFAVPAQVSAEDYYGGAEDSWYGGADDYSYDSWYGGAEDSWYGGAEDSYYYADSWYGGADDNYYEADSNYYTADSYSSDCSSCGGYQYYSAPSYSYSTPSYSTPTYRYSAPTYSSCTSSSCTRPSTYSTPSYTSPSYVYTTNTAVANAKAAAKANSVSTSASNSSVGDIVNNNVNNNTVVVNTPPTTTTPTTPPAAPALDGYCVINPSYANINQDVAFSASAVGGTGSYTYSWSGTDGISSNSQSFTGRFGSTGTKTATVTIQSGNQSVTRTCNVNIQGQSNANLSAYCVASPSVSNIGQTVTWTAYVNGGTSGNYTYSWNGTDGLYGSNQTAYMNYNSFGTKTANVTVYGNGQAISASCNMNVQGQTAAVTVIRTPDQGTPVSGIYLSQIPATGIDFSMKTILFTLGLVIWSAFVAYVMINRRKAALAGNVSAATSSFPSLSKAEVFKMKNMQKQGIVA